MQIRRPFHLKRPGLTVQLFLAVLATAALVTIAMGAATQLNFSRGFIGYLERQAVQQMEAALPRLQRAYTERGQGSWEFVRQRPGAWFRLLEPEPEPVREGSGNGETITPWHGELEQVAPHLLGLGRRLTLLDAQRQRVIGYPHFFATSQQREIVVEGRTVGWVVLAPIESVTDAAALRFEQEQLRATFITGLLALLLAALVAWWAARALLAPVREVARATHQLAAGRFDTQVAVRSQDEVGQLAQDFNQLAQALGRTEQMRRDYMADISHELRTPLAVLRGEIEAMQDGIRPLDTAHLSVLHGEVETLTQLVNDLHELALADVGALHYRKQELELGALVAREVAAFGGRCAERNLQLEVLAVQRPILLHADPDRLRQLLHNLLDNAVRYTHPGGQLRVQTQTLPGGWVGLDVMDSAPGVAPALLPRLFERFFRVESSRSRPGGGSGLGLAICRSIVQAHGGSIEAQASPLGGVWVRIRLPIHPSSCA